MAFTKTPVACFALGLILTVLIPAAGSQTLPLSLEDSAGQPAWQLVNIPGRYEAVPGSEGKALIVDAAPDATGYWRSGALLFEPSAIYTLRFRGNRLTTTEGALISGPPFANEDQLGTAKDWQDMDVTFMTPAVIDPATAWVRLGHWHANGPVAYDSPQIARAQAVHRRFDDIELGEGEKIDGHRYTFNAPWAITLTNHTRPLVEHNAFFNTARFVFGKDNYFIMRHTIGQRMQQSVNVTTGVSYLFDGVCVVEASTNGTEWHELGRADKTAGSIRAAVPADLLPAKEIWIRVRAESDTPLDTQSGMGSFGVGGYTYEAELDGPPLLALGSTAYVAVPQVDDNLEVQVESLFGNEATTDNTLRLRVRNTTSEPIRQKLVVTTQSGAKKPVHTQERVTLEPGWNDVSLAYALPEPGAYKVSFSLGDFQGDLKTYVSELFEVNYGAVVPGSSEDVALWTAPSGWKVWKNRPTPEAAAGAVHLRTARNEAEAAQLVLQPRAALRGLTVRATTLMGADGAELAAETIEILKVRYVPVAQPTDISGVAAEWPDPLPTFSSLDIEAGKQQPLWVRVKPPKDAQAGIYEGTLELAAEGYAASVPLRVEVYDFTLPDRMTCATAMSLDPGKIWRYQKLTDPAQRKEVMDKYLQCLSDHHISPYNPTPLSGIGVTWPDIKPGDDIDPKDLKVTLDWAAWDAAMEKAINEYHFNTVQVGVPGMGASKLLGFSPPDPVFTALFESYASQLEAHLREKGWLDEAYVYWFDEPAPNDYEFVMDSMTRLHKAAPGLRRMLTEQVEDPLLGGVDLWCPTSHNFKWERADERREAGEQYWWYVCTEPKYPYATLFIDHPATELRVWLWQTWERDIEGVLIWTTNYWTSDPAYPDSPQNPYSDPMGWTSGYGTGPGQRIPWGNGDGRLIYPPEAAADANPPQPVLEGPVESIRIETLRDGIEDYEYLAMLKRLLDVRTDLSSSLRQKYEKLLEVPDSITASMTEFTRDPAAIEARRDEIARAIEELSQTKAP
jgi:hypothetical protein